ncbi:MAG: protease modulator HflC [Victivallaceae bacterium]|nr:protease modulator HflC [Victivallaceae bacterium]
MATEKIFKHWPTMLLGVAVAAILLVAVFSFQLNQTERAVVTTFGRPSEVNTPGLHFRWPFPFQRIYRFDCRIRCFDGSSGKIEETGTADNQNILVGIYVNYRISDVKTFFVSMDNLTKAEAEMNSWMRSAKNAVFGQFRFSQIINTDPKEMKLDEIQELIKQRLTKQAADYGIEIVSVGINSLGVPQSISEKVFERMIQERARVAARYLAEGEREAKDIRIKADSSKAEILANAEAEAKEIRAQGDAEAAQYYAVFKQNPELAEFLRKLDSLRSIMKDRTTLVLDTDVAPFNLFKPGAEVLTPAPTEKK